jgi:hypothetical protein
MNFNRLPLITRYRGREGDGTYTRKSYQHEHDAGNNMNQIKCKQFYLFFSPHGLLQVIAAPEKARECAGRIGSSQHQCYFQKRR